MASQFEPISLEHQHRYLDYLEKCPQVTSDYSFVNLWAWAEEYGLLWSWEDGCVWIRQTRPEELDWAPVGLWADVDWKRIAENKPGRTAQFIRVPEKLGELWRKRFGDGIRLEDSREHWDYLYEASDLIALSGNRFHKKKNLLNQFKKKYDFRYVPLGPDQIDRAFAMQEDWCTWRDCESMDTLAAENRSIQRVLGAWDSLPTLTGGSLIVDDRMVAYTVAERLQEDMLLIHFEKANQDFKGAYQAINQIFLSHEVNGYRYVNREQDLGDEGLMKAKVSYNPIGFLKKYKAFL